MPLVHFEMINSEGVLERRLIPSEKIEFIRPLSPAEQDFAAKMRDGTYTADMIANASHRGQGAPDVKARGEIFDAHLKGTDVTDGSVQSILVTSDGKKYCLPKSVGELARCAVNRGAGSVIALSPIVGPTRPVLNADGPDSTKAHP